MHHKLLSFVPTSFVLPQWSSISRMKWVFIFTSGKKALWNPGGRESGMSARDSLLCYSSAVSFQGPVVTEEKKCGQNRVRIPLPYSLVALQSRRAHKSWEEEWGKRWEKVVRVRMCYDFQTTLFCQRCTATVFLWTPGKNNKSIKGYFKPKV